MKTKSVQVAGGLLPGLVVDYARGLRPNSYGTWRNYRVVKYANYCNVYHTLDPEHIYTFF